MIKSGLASNVINFVLFQAGWIACVLYPGLPAAGLALLFLGFHIAVISRNRWSELQFIGLGTVLGGILDGVWFRTGILDDGSGTVLLTPPWLVAIWALFMTTLCHSLDWISKQRWLLFAFPPLAGPFAYWSASQLGAVELPDFWLSIVALAIGWLVIFPGLLYLRRLLYPELLA
ncbi:MAG: DUF2878 domain-containing protein [Gammaproteobacteria bacterium]|nr:MAG: DUF2878 domain-containing protein [Gammaproteobacteria bacterium]